MVKNPGNKLQIVSWFILAAAFIFGSIAAYLEIEKGMDIGLYWMVASMGLFALSGFFMSLSAKLEQNK